MFLVMVKLLGSKHFNKEVMHKRENVMLKDCINMNDKGKLNVVFLLHLILFIYLLLYLI